MTCASRDRGLTSRLVEVVERSRCVAAGCIRLLWVKQACDGVVLETETVASAALAEDTLGEVLGEIQAQCQLGFATVLVIALAAGEWSWPHHSLPLIVAVEGTA